MKFLCKTEFFHSGNRLYASDAVYDITAKAAEELIAVDTKIPLGALSFFTPADEEAANFVKKAERNPELCENQNKGDEAPPVTSQQGSTDAPKQASRKELVEEAKHLGIKGADFMSADKLKEAIEAAKQNFGTTAPPANGGGTTPQG